MQVSVSRRSGAPTLSDVAKVAGVSPMTVSRVINKDQAVREETRERVNAAIAALNYAPNSAARLLAGAAQTRIAMIYGNPSSAYLSEVLVGGLTETSRTDVQLLLEKCGDEAGAAAIVRSLVERRVEGVILPPPFCDDAEAVLILLEAGTATVVLGTGAAADGAFAVAIDDSRAAEEMTRRLLGLGHRRIAFIAGNPNQTASARRLDGYRRAMREAGHADDPSLIAQGDFSYRSGLAAADRLLDLAEPPTAIFASNDDMAAAAIAAAHRRHLDIPQDLSVCGFDDTALATTISPELTTVRQPVAQMAQAAVEMLITAVRRRRSGQSAPVLQRLFAHEIVARRSDGPVRAPPRA